MARVYTEEQKQAARVRAREWHLANRERARVAAKKWYALNAEVAKERARRWREEHPEMAKAADARKRANRSPEYLEKRRIDEQNRRARMKLSGGRLTKGLAKRLYALQNGLCVYCRTDLNCAFDLDHIVPISKGGAHSDENIQLLCPTCNRRKHTKSAEAFAKMAA